MSAGRVKNFLHVAQTASGAYPTSYQIGIGGLVPRGKVAGE
jgi:hypothetical protein